MLCVPLGPVSHDVENYAYAVQAGCIAVICYFLIILRLNNALEQTWSQQPMFAVVYTKGRHSQPVIMMSIMKRSRLQRCFAQ